MKKLIIVANRLPVRFEKTADGMRMHESEGGLATGLASLSSQFTKEWVGWPGLYADSSEEQQAIATQMGETYHPVFLNEQEIDQYYKGFSNETLWPLSHYFMEYTHFSNENWEQYKAVNQKFCDKVLEVATEGDIIWVHDYHLTLLPGLLREKLGNRNPIGFFLHIPFPSFELFRTLPWRKEILNGILGAHLAGFHTFEYLQNFTNTVHRITGYESRLGAIDANGSLSHVDVFPMSINFKKFSDAAHSADTERLVKKFRGNFGDVKVILSVDRLDYTKGIVNRLQAFNSLLEKHPEVKGRISFIMLTVPSRDDVGEYKNLKVEVDELVGNINGRHSSLSWTPVHYFYRSLPFGQLVALYNLADICFVTPLRDGMNLVAKEYVASRNEGGVLILSEMAGSALELDGALLINPNDENAMTAALHTALHMSGQEQQQRMLKMQEHVAVNSVEKWGSDFTTQLNLIYEQARQVENRNINGEKTADICASFSHASNRLVFLDYDGTLRAFCNNPYDATPGEELKLLLQELSRHATVVLVSGRDHYIMEEWFGDLDLHLVAEHGVWRKENGDWKQARNLSSAWKAELHPLMQKFVEKTPGSFIEEKPFSLAFHYRRADSWMAEVRAPQLMSALRGACESNNLDVLDGNKVVEVRVAGVDKGSAALKWLATGDWDFVMAIGDDRTDEDMFNVMPESAYTIKVGTQQTLAQWRIRNCDEVNALLRHISTYARMQESGNQLYKTAV